MFGTQMNKYSVIIICLSLCGNTVQPYSPTTQASVQNPHTDVDKQDTSPVTETLEDLQTGTSKANGPSQDTSTVTETLEDLTTNTFKTSKETATATGSTRIERLPSTKGSKSTKSSTTPVTTSEKASTRFTVSSSQPTSSTLQPSTSSKRTTSYKLQTTNASSTSKMLSSLTTSKATKSASTASTSFSSTASTTQVKTSPTSPTTSSTLPSEEGIHMVELRGNKKKLSLSDIAQGPSTPNSSVKITSRSVREKRTKQNPSQKTRKHRDAQETKKSKGKESKAKSVVFTAATTEKKKGQGRKGNKKKNGKLQGKKGEQGPAGPAGPKGEKGAPGEAASSSMPMQAATSSVLTEHFGPDKDVIIPFDLKLIDMADNYDNTTGVFICTIPGTYVISLYLMSHPGAKVNARIFINSRPIAALWADDSKNSGFYPSSSIQTISRLEFGDQVYVMLVDGGYGESWVHANYNAFTLFLLYEDMFFK